MSKNILKEKAKNQKRERSAKKAKRKIIIIIAVFAAVIIAAAAAGYIINSAGRQDTPEIYSYHGQSVHLFSDGSFSAALAHNVQKRGTYTKKSEDGRTAVSFNVNGNIETGYIIDGSLHLPAQWDDGHGHGNVFPRVN